MNWYQAALLGLIQGLTEFLPVSSSGHLELGNVLLGVKSSNNLLFAVIVHAATALSTIVVYRKDILEILSGLLEFKWNESWDFSLKIIISMIPVGIVGILFEDQIESFFSGNILLVGCMLLVTASLLLFTHFKKPGTKEVTWLNSIIIGFAQALAIMPGISRSGSTIATALLLGTDKEKATRFSFLMVLLPILGASLLKLKDYIQNPSIGDQITAFPLILGFLTAFISGFLACKWMIRIVKKGKLTYFAIYCAIIGFVAVLSHFIL